MAQPNQFAPDFEKSDGVVPVVVQDSVSGDVLTLAYMNAEAYEETIATGQTVFFSRSRNALWRKGETSGHTQTVREILVDCDSDALLVKVEQKGGACHKGFHSCFYRAITDEGLVEIAAPVFDPDAVYRGDS